MITHIVVDADRRLSKDEQASVGWSVAYGAEPVQDLEGTILRQVRLALDNPKVGRIVIERDWDDER